MTSTITVSPNVNPSHLIDHVLCFDYPASNHAGVRRRMEPRRVLVKEVRDTETQPLDPATVELDPLLRRGRVLLKGEDLDRGGERSFYLDSMEGTRLAMGDEAKAFEGVQIVGIKAGVERVVRGCLTGEEAEVYLESFNGRTPITKEIGEGRRFYLPRLARNLAG